MAAENVWCCRVASMRLVEATSGMRGSSQMEVTLRGRNGKKEPRKYKHHVTASDPDIHGWVCLESRLGFYAVTTSTCTTSSSPPIGMPLTSIGQPLPFAHVSTRIALPPPMTVVARVAFASTVRPPSMHVSAPSDLVRLSRMPVASSAESTHRTRRDEVWPGLACFLLDRCN